MQSNGRPEVKDCNKDKRFGNWFEEYLLKTVCKMCFDYTV